MAGSAAITVLDEFRMEDRSYICDLDIIDLDLEIDGKEIHFSIGVADKEARLADIVPLAREISTKLAITVLDTIGQDGQTVPCCKGCSVCCNYLIPLSVPEVFRLREELLTMPTEKSNRILQSCIETSERILDNRSPISSLKSFSESEPPHISQISKWYAGLKLGCPFLSDGLCMLYEQRALACREHIVTGSAFFCETNHKDNPNVVPMPVSVLEALGQLAAELEGSEIEALILPLAFAWVRENLQRAERTWAAVEMVQRFVEILKQMAMVSKNSVIPALST